MTNQAPLQSIGLGLSLATFFVVAYLACISLALVIPDGGLHQPWLQFLPGFAWTPLGILIGFAESALYGFVSGAIFAPIFNVFNVSNR
jgi:hypothetical protein